MKKLESFTSIWDAIEDTPQAAASMEATSSLMMALSNHIEKNGLTQAQAANLLGVTESQVSDLLRGKINRFSFDLLLSMAVTARILEPLSPTTCKVARLAKLKVTIDQGVADAKSGRVSPVNIADIKAEGRRLRVSS